MSASPEKMMVDWAMAVFAQQGCVVEWDDTDGVWDIETPNGWRTCWTSADLCRVAREVLK